MERLAHRFAVEAGCSSRVVCRTLQLWFDRVLKTGGRQTKKEPCHTDEYTSLRHTPETRNGTAPGDTSRSGSGGLLTPSHSNDVPFADSIPYHYGNRTRTAV